MPEPKPLTFEETKKLLGISLEPTLPLGPLNQPGARITFDDTQRLLGISIAGRPQPEEEAGFWTEFAQNVAAKTSLGIAARTTGVWGYEPKEHGIVPTIAEEILAFGLDPATYVGGGLGKGAA